MIEKNINSILISEEGQNFLIMLPYHRLKEILSSNKLAMYNEGDLVKLIEDFIKYRQERSK